MILFNEGEPAVKLSGVLNARPFGQWALAVFAVVMMPFLAGAETVDRIVAIINDSVITMSELNAATNLALEKSGGSDKLDGAAALAMKKKVLDDLIEQKLVKQASDKAGIDVSEKEIDNAVEDVKKENGMTQDTLLLTLARTGLTFKEYREQLKEQIRQVKFVNKEFRSKVTIEPEDVEDYYRQHKDDFQVPATYKISMIFIPNGDKVVAAQKLKMIQEGLSKGTDFKELASEYSEGPTASSGGDMGYLKLNEMDKYVQDAVVKLKTNGISPAIQAADGIYFIRLDDMKPPQQRPFEEVKGLAQDKLYRKIMDDRFSFWLNEVKKYAHVEIRL